MALFVLENTSADQNLNWLLSEGYTIDGVEVLDDDEEGYTGNNGSDDIHIDKAKYERMSREEKAKIDQETADELGEIEDRLETAKRDFKTKFSNRPTSWFESKLIGFKKMLVKFRAKHKATKGNKSKTILQKIIYVITNIIKFITDKLIKLAKHTPMGRDGRRYDNEKKSARRSLMFDKRRAKEDIEDAYASNIRRKEHVNFRTRMAAVTDHTNKMAERINKQNKEFEDQLKREKQASRDILNKYRGKAQKEWEEQIRKRQEKTSRDLDELLNN